MINIEAELKEREKITSTALYVRVLITCSDLDSHQTFSNLSR